MCQGHQDKEGNSPTQSSEIYEGVLNKEIVFTIIDYNYICVNQLPTCDRCSDIHIMANLFFFRFSFLCVTVYLNDEPAGNFKS